MQKTTADRTTADEKKVAPFVIKWAILNFIHIEEEDENGRYSACLMLKKDTKETAENIKKLQTVADHYEVDLEDLIRDGDESDFGNLHGFWLLNVKTKFMPKVQYLDSMKEKKLYNGITAFVKVSPYEWTFKKRSGVSFGFNAVKVAMETPSLDIDVFDDEDFNIPELPEMTKTDTDLPF